MPRTTVLFADDQIPDDDIPDDDVKKVLHERHPTWGERFINAFVKMRGAVKTLRNAGYDVTIANTYHGALELISNEHYDVAIIDLGWFADKALPRHQRGYAGWDLCDAIDEADERLGPMPTKQIIYSNRFNKDATLAMRAADMDKLPLFKSYSEANQQALRAAVKFIESLVDSSSPPVKPAAIAPAAAPIDRWQTYDGLLEKFNLDEISEILFLMGIDEEILRGDTKPEKIRELILYCERHSRLEDFVVICRKKRPGVF